MARALLDLRPRASDRRTGDKTDAVYTRWTRLVSCVAPAHSGFQAFLPLPAAGLAFLVAASLALPLPLGSGAFRLTAGFGEAPGAGLKKESILPAGQPHALTTAHLQVEGLTCTAALTTLHGDMHVCCTPALQACRL